MAKDDLEVGPVCRGHSRARLAQPRDPSTTVPLQLDDSVDNWITAGWWLNRTGAPITYFRSQWKVPRPPRTDRGQLIFLFNGMQPGRQDEQTILQPVLAWGLFGSRWVVSSFLYPNIAGNPQNTPPVEVEPGTVLTGVIQLIGHGSHGFSYRCGFESISGTELTVHHLPQLVYCVVTLEADESGCGNRPYELKEPSDYPDAKRTRFRRIKVKADCPIASLHWRPVNYLEQITNYGEHTTIVSESSTNGAADIFYSK